MADREKAIRILEGHYKNFVLRHNGELLTVNELIALLKAQEQFLQWLARLVTHEDGDGAECEIICRRLHDMGYVEKYEENGVVYWRAVAVIDPSEEEE